MTSLDTAPKAAASPSALGLEPIYERLSSLFERLRAQPPERPPLLRIVLREPGHFASVGPDDWLWHDGRRQLTMIGRGCLEAYEAEGAFERYRRIEQRLGDLRASSLVIGEATDETDLERLPLLFGGFSFSAAQREDGHWAGWPAARFVLPRSIDIQRADGDARRVVHHRVTDASPAALEALLAELARPARRGQSPDRSGRAPAPLAQRSLEDPSSWRRRVEAAKHAERLRYLEKVVLARAVLYEAPKGERFDPSAILAALRAEHPTAYTFSIPGADGSHFLGASPELLLRVDGLGFETQALAGTCARGADAAEDEDLGSALLANHKELGEQAIVTRSIVEVLRSFDPELSAPKAPRLARFAQAQHLETPLSGRLEHPTPALELVRRLHPTPAVGGYPATRSERWLDEREPLDRGWYAGPVGWLSSSGSGCFTVAIRSALIRGAEALAFAGAGIVPHSCADAEWRETELKLQTVARALRTKAEQG